MIKRGKVLRDPRTGPGLLMIEGQQYPFCLDDVWQSEMPPVPGRVVQVKFDRAGQITAITAAPEFRPGREQAERSVDTPRGAALKILRTIAAKCGFSNLRRR